MGAKKSITKALGISGLLKNEIKGKTFLEKKLEKINSDKNTTENVADSTPTTSLPKSLKRNLSSNESSYNTSQELELISRHKTVLSRKISQILTEIKKVKDEDKLINNLISVNNCLDNIWPEKGHSFRSKIAFFGDIVNKLFFSLKKASEELDGENFDISSSELMSVKLLIDDASANKILINDPEIFLLAGSRGSTPDETNEAKNNSAQSWVQTLKRRKLNFGNKAESNPLHSALKAKKGVNDLLGLNEPDTIIISDSDGESDISGMQPLERIEYDNF